MHDFRLPAGLNTRCFSAPGPRGEGPFHTLVLAPEGQRPTLNAFLVPAGEPGALLAHLTHDAGVTWPDAVGESLLRHMLNQGGIVALSFASLEDAKAAERRALALATVKGVA